MALASKWSTSPAAGSRGRPQHALTRRPVLWRSFGALALVSLLQAAPAAALPDDACIRDERCREHHDKAIKLYNDGYYEEALTEFQAAYEARKLPLLLINIGRTMQKLGRPKESITYYERFLAAESKPDPDVLKRVNKYLGEAKALLGPDGSDPNERKPAAPGGGDQRPAIPAAPLPPPPPPPGRNLLIAGGAIAGLGVAGLLTGVGLFAGANSEYKKFQSSVDEFEKLSAKSSAQSLGLGSTISYAVGAAALVGGGALIAVGAKKYIEHKRAAQQPAPTGSTAPAAPQALLVPTASGVGAVVMGEF
jgi:tetratricopeptide (TPR) repeat protein